MVPEIRIGGNGPQFRINRIHFATTGHGRILRNASASGFESARDHIPIDDVVQDCLNMVGAAILVIEIIGVLPYVDADQRGQVLRQGTVAAGGRDDGELVAVLREPPPTRTNTAVLSVFSFAFMASTEPTRSGVLAK
jgi:hypothetical protein